MIRVLIADDDHLMRAGLAELLTSDPTIEIAGQAATGREAVDRARRLAPDVVLMDVRMPDLDGIAATAALTRAEPGGARAHPHHLRAGRLHLRWAPRGRVGLPAQAHPTRGPDRRRPHGRRRRRAALPLGHPPRDRPHGRHRCPISPASRASNELTPREREVLELIARGLSNREIAAALAVEESTVRSHVKRILMKLGLRDRVQVVIFAYENGINRFISDR